MSNHGTTETERSSMWGHVARAVMVAMGLLALVLSAILFSVGGAY